MMRFLLFFSVSFLALACAPPAEEFTEAMKAQIAAEVDATAADWWDAWADVDYARGMGFFADEPEAAWAGDTGVFYTVAGMKAEWEGAWGATWHQQQIDFTESRTIVLAPDVAYTIRQYDAVVTDTSGAQLPQITGVETLVWVKRNGEWKVLLGHESALREFWQVLLDQESTEDSG